MNEQQIAAVRQALSKIKAARDCHPNAVQTLIFEAEELLESALEQQPAAPTNCRHCGGPDNVLCGGQCKQQPADEPVAWEMIALKFATGKKISYKKPKNVPSYVQVRPLYTRPQPAAQWVEVEEIKLQGDKLMAKLREKNGGKA